MLRITTRDLLLNQKVNQKTYLNNLRPERGMLCPAEPNLTALIHMDKVTRFGKMICYPVVIHWNGCDHLV
jgi:hypothetical protein